jgi:hypothetical protein
MGAVVICQNVCDRFSPGGGNLQKCVRSILDGRRVSGFGWSVGFGGVVSGYGYSVQLSSVASRNENEFSQLIFFAVSRLLCVPHKSLETAKAGKSGLWFILRIKLERLALLSVLDESPWRVALVLVVPSFGVWVVGGFVACFPLRPPRDRAVNPPPSAVPEDVAWHELIVRTLYVRRCVISQTQECRPWISILVSDHSVRSERSRTEVDVIW